MSVPAPVSPGRLRGLTRLLAVRLSEVKAKTPSERSIDDIAAANLDVLSVVLVQRRRRYSLWPSRWLDEFLSLFAVPEYLDGRHFRELEKLLHLLCETHRRLIDAKYRRQARRVESHLNDLEARLVEALQFRIDGAQLTDLPRYIVERSLIQISTRSLTPDDPRARVLRWSKASLAQLLVRDAAFEAVLSSLRGAPDGWERRAYLCFIAEYWCDMELDVCRERNWELRASRFNRLFQIVVEICAIDADCRDLNEILVSLYILRRVNAELSKEPENRNLGERLMIVGVARQIAEPFLDHEKVLELMRRIEEDEGLSSQVA